MDSEMNTSTLPVGVHLGSNLQKVEGEVASWTWRCDAELSDANQTGVANKDPGLALQGFLAAYGLPAQNLLPGLYSNNDADIQAVTAPDGRVAHFFASAAGCAALAGLDSRYYGKPSPAPKIPDIAVVVYDDARAALAALGQKSRSEGAQNVNDSGPLIIGAWRPSWTTAEHTQAIERVRAAIAAGEIYQANVVGHHSAPYQGDPMPALHAIAALPDARYGAVLAHEDWAIATATPELLLRIDLDEPATITTQPIKGTAPATPAGRKALLSSAKERAEHIMIVDLMRNDLARIARTGTVRVPELFQLRAWSGLWHAESTVRAELVAQVGLADVLAAICPGGSVTGAPKRAAMSLIADVEPVGRGPAMGAMGWISARQIELALTIRTVAADGERLHLWAGGGITIDSNPAAEIDEALAKAAPLKAIIAAG